MATVDVRLNNAAFYDVVRFDIVKGEMFTAVLNGFEGETFWYSYNDQALEIFQTGNEADITALVTGATRILILDAADVKVKELLIRVVDAITPQAANLGVSVGQPEPK